MSGRDAGWRFSTLSNVGVTLIDCVHATPNEASSGYPYIAIPQMKSGRIDFTDARIISAEDFAEWTRKAKPQRHDVVLSRRTNPGVTAIDYEGRDFALGQNLVLLRADGTKVFPPFLKWLCQGPEWWVQINKNLNVGAVFDSLKCADVPNFELTIPTLAEQRAIAAVLGALDDKIEANRRMNATLEAMARALFKSWFVDFDPVRAKIEGREPAIAPDVAALFPARLTDSPLGPIPEGWEVIPLRDLAAFTKGRSYKSEELKEGDAALVNLKSIERGGGYREDGLKPYAGAHKPDQVVRPGEIVLALTDVTQAAELIGRVARVRSDPKARKLVASLDLAIVRPIRPESKGWLFGTMSTSPFTEHALSFTAGTTVLHLALQSAIDGFHCAVPSPELLAEFEIVSECLATRADTAAEQSRTLTQLRDLLLPKLLSGALRARDGQAMVEDAA